VTTKHGQPDRRIIILSLCIIFTVWVSFFIVKLTAPSNFLDHDQERPAAYMLDAAVNGNWIIQRDDTGNICSKPPLYTWMGALLTLAFGRINHFALLFPSALGVLGCCILIWRFGFRYFGASTALLAALVYVISPSGAKMICLARTDSLFAFMVSLSAFLCFSAWISGRGWIWFWLAAAAATLTKSPLGVILAGAGLLAYFWERRETSSPGFRGNMWLGFIIFLAITLGWFSMAYWQLGQPVIDKMIGRELIGHANWSERAKIPGQDFYKPFLYFLSRFAPWSIFACMGFWRIWKHPSVNPEERRFERFLLCFFLFGLLIFSLAPHQRADLLFPLFPAAALLAGREMIRCFNVILSRRVLWWLVSIWIAVLPILWVYYNMVRSKQEFVTKTRGVQEVAQEFEARFGRYVPLVYADAPLGLQFYLNTMRPRVSLQEAAERLAGKESVLVAVQDIAGLKNYLPPGIKVYEIIRWPEKGQSFVSIVGRLPDR
jgi:4-amino-4-deoxy-L-arabinose transferase-like glycosyltransferase